MAATIKDVAKLAGVSISTVSRVINDSKPVSPEARRKVVKAIEDLGYKPNEVARSLVTKKSNLIGVIVNDIGNSYVAQILRGIEEIGRMYDYDIVLCSSYGDEETELKFIQLLLRKQAEGIILVSEILNQSAIDYMKDVKVPFVYLNRHYEVLDFPTVKISNEGATKKVMDYLISQNHKNILYVGEDKDLETTVEKYKVATYKDSMEDIGSKPIIYQVPGNQINDGYSHGEDVLDLIEKNHISAVFCSQDELAIGLISYLYDKGIKVPEDISFVGYGDISLASIYRPKLTTIREPYYDFGAVAIRRILKFIKGESIEEQTIDLPVQLMVRESVKKINL